MNNLLGITVRPELVYDPKGAEWRERALTAEAKLDAVRALRGNPFSEWVHIDEIDGAIKDAALQGESDEK